MAKTADAQYGFGFRKGFLFPHNPDRKPASSALMLGSNGTLSFSGAAAPAAAVGHIRVDGGTVLNFTADLSTADTPAEWATAVGAGLTAASITGYTASADSTTGRCKFVKTAAPSVCVEVYGEVFELAGFGFGKGLKMIVTDECESWNPSPTKKDDQDKSVANGRSVDTSVKVKGYKKGFSGSLVDLPLDYAMMALVENGTIDTNGIYHGPTPAQSKAAPSFEFWTLRDIYDTGENREDQLIGHELVKYLSCSGSVQTGTVQADWDKATYTIDAYNYIDAEAVQHGAEERRILLLSDVEDAAIIAILEAI